MTVRDAQRLVGVFPALVTTVQSVLASMDALGHPMFVIEGVRSAARQKDLYAQGRTLPGKRVTNCDGITRQSNHQVKPDGYGHAVDCAFVDADPFSEHHPWQEYGAQAEAAGLVWGGHFKALPADDLHVELA